MLSRIAQELYWIGRRLSRAEHTARMLDGVFHADLQARPDNPAQCRLSWDSLLAIMGAEHTTDRPATRDEVVTRLTLDHEDPAAILHCVTRAREGARTVRDVFSAEMWEAMNTFHLALLRQDVSAALRAGPYSVYALVRERCGLFWGVTRRTMLRDEANAFLEAGAAIEAADMVLRMLRVALPPREGARSPRATCATARRSPCCRPSAASRPTAAPSPPRRWPARSRASCSTSAPTRTRSRRRSRSCTTRCPPPTTRPAHPARPARRPPARRPRVPLPRVHDDADLPGTLSLVQRELVQVDADITQRYFGGAHAATRLMTA